MSERWVVRDGTVRGKGLYLGDSPSGLGRRGDWYTSIRNAIRFDERHLADSWAEAREGRVVKLVAKRKATRNWEAQAAVNAHRAERAEAEVAGLRDVVGKLGKDAHDRRVNAWKAVYEAQDRASLNLAHARRWKALAKRLLGERDAFRRNVDALLAEYDNLRGPAPSDEEIGRAAHAAYWGPFHERHPWESEPEDRHPYWTAAGKAARALGGEPVELTDEECERLADVYADRYATTADRIRAVLRAAGRYTWRGREHARP
jgi:hypothetical protein